MATFLPSSVESFEGGHGLRHHLLKKRRSALLVMIMVTGFLSSVESCEGGHGQCHHLLEKKGSALLVLRRRG